MKAFITGLLKNLAHPGTIIGLIVALAIPFLIYLGPNVGHKDTIKYLDLNLPLPLFLVQLVAAIVLFSSLNKDFREWLKGILPEKSFSILMLIFAAVSLAIGILALLNKTVFGESQHLVIGIFMLSEAALDLITYFLLSRGMKKQNSLRDEEDFDLPVKPEALDEPAGPLPESEHVPESEE